MPPQDCKRARVGAAGGRGDLRKVILEFQDDTKIVLAHSVVSGAADYGIGRNPATSPHYLQIQDPQVYLLIGLPGLAVPFPFFYCLTQT